MLIFFINLIYKIKMKEYILSAANYYNDEIKHQHQPNNIEIGFVICGRRHHNCIGTFTQISGFHEVNFGLKLTIPKFRDLLQIQIDL